MKLIRQDAQVVSKLVNITESEQFVLDGDVSHVIILNDDTKTVCRVDLDFVNFYAKRSSK